MTAPLAGLHSSSTCPAGSPAPTATKLLADGGADVIKVEPPRAIRCARWSASGAPIGPGRTAPCSASWRASKQSVVADPDEPTDAALRRATAGRGRRGGVVARVAPWPTSRRCRPQPICPRAPAPDRHRDHPVRPGRARGVTGPATEFTLQAWSGGIVGLGRGAPGPGAGVRRRPGGGLADRGLRRHRHAGRSRARRRATARGELVDLSMLEAQILGLTYYPVTYFEMLGRPWRTERGRPCPAWQATPRRAGRRWGAAPPSSGATCARCRATPSGSTRTAR